MSKTKHVEKRKTLYEKYFLNMMLKILEFYYYEKYAYEIYKYCSMKLDILRKTIECYF